MSFLTPWLLLLGIPILGAILVLYLLKVKRQDKVVSSVFLWRDLVKDMQANQPFQKLRYSLLLLLQLAIAALLVYSFARPYIITKGLRGKSFALILDGSASMQSTDVGKSRFDVAKQQAIKVIDGLSRGDEAMVVLATSQAEVLTTFTDDKTKLRNVIAAAKPADTGTNLRDAILVAAQAAQKKQEPHLYVLSDGAAPALDELNVPTANVEFVKIGKRCNNVGIIAMDIRRGMGDDGQYECFSSIQNFADEAKKVSVELYLDQSIVDVRDIDLPAHGRQAMVFSNFGDARGILKLSITTPDDLAVDNVAYANFSPKATTNVLLLTKGNFFLENALNADPKISLAKSSPDQWAGMTPDQRARYDLIVFDGVGPEVVAEGSYLFVNAVPPDGPATNGGTLTNPQIADWARTHPLTRFVNFDTDRLQKAISLQPKVWGEPIVDTAGGPIIVAGERRSSKFVIVGFDVSYDNTDFSLRASFPIFISNCVAWLTSKVTFGEEIMTHTGSPMAIDVPKGMDGVAVTKPRGEVADDRIERTPFVFADTDEAGLYHFKGKGFNAVRAANLLDRAESDTTPNSAMKIGGKAIALAKGAHTAKSELWRLAVILALGVLGFEWYAYHKRL